MKSSIGSPKERADLIVRKDWIEVVIGTQPAGQGHETSFAQVTADLLGVPFEQVKITLGDTDIVSAGGGTHSGRSMRHACDRDRARLGRSHRQGQSAVGASGRCAARQGRVRRRCVPCAGSNRALTGSNCHRSPKQGRLPVELQGGLRVRRDNEMHTPVFPNGACLCEIEVDPETGAVDIKRYASVDDVGRCVNPLIVHGQTHGGIAQGVGQALWESAPSIRLRPAVDRARSWITACRASTTCRRSRRDRRSLVADQSVRRQGGGEGGTTRRWPWLRVQSMTRLSDSGHPHIDMPITPIKIWIAIQDYQEHHEAASSDRRSTNVTLTVNGTPRYHAMFPTRRCSSFCCASISI